MHHITPSWVFILFWSWYHKALYFALINIFPQKHLLPICIVLVSPFCTYLHISCILLQILWWPRYWLPAEPAPPSFSAPSQTTNNTNGKCVHKNTNEHAGIQRHIQKHANTNTPSQTTKNTNGKCVHKNTNKHARKQRHIFSSKLTFKS